MGVAPSPPTHGSSGQGGGCARAVKRALDVVGALVGLVLTLPVLLVCALAVRIESGPGVLFRQQRVGQHGRVFTMLKLRSLRPPGDAGDVTWIADPDLIGPVGRFLRRTSIDELPQLVNVLRGDMSLVGPRPERPHFVDRFTATVPGYALRHRAPVGLTGLAAVHGLRGDTSIAHRVRLDNHYIDNWSLRLDLLILLRTVGHLLSGPRAAPPAPAPAEPSSSTASGQPDRAQPGAPVPRANRALPVWPARASRDRTRRRLRVGWVPVGPVRAVADAAARRAAPLTTPGRLIRR